MKRKSPLERFLALSDKQKNREVAIFDKELPESYFHPLSPAQRKQWRRIQKKMGRPRVGRGAKVISVTIEKGLLSRTDALARKHNMTRAALIARALETVLSRAG